MRSVQCTFLLVFLLSTQVINSCGQIGENAGLLFATNAFDHYNDLVNPILDMNTISDELSGNYGFSCDQNTGLSSRCIISLLNEYAQKNYTEFDQLLIYFGGLGYYDTLTNEGSLICTNTQTTAEDPEKISFIPLPRLRALIDSIPCKHILVILDIGFGGAFGNLKDRSTARSGKIIYEDISTDEMISEKMQFISRIYISSGGIEYVPDGRPGFHSPFARKFIEALRNYGGEDGVLSINEIRPFIDRVSPQPRIGEFGSNEAGSDFLFISNTQK